MKTIWIIAADEKEIPQFELWLNQSSPGRKNIEFKTCGIGLFESFYNFSSLLNAASLKSGEEPDGVLLAGTAGSPYAEDIFRISLSNHFLNPQFAGEDLPEFLPIDYKTRSLDFQRIPGELLAMPVYSTFGVSRTRDNFKKGMPPAWENMEALSLSYICHKRKIPFMALLCCTNQICSQARMQWKENFQQAGEKLDHMLKLLLPGLFFDNQVNTD